MTQAVPHLVNRLVMTPRTPSTTSAGATNRWYPPSISPIPDDLAFEDWLARLDTLADAHQHLREGEQVSGPAAETYRHRVQAATRFASRVLRTKRHAHAMLSNPDLQIFPGKGMTCVLDPKRAVTSDATVNPVGQNRQVNAARR